MNIVSRQCLRIFKTDITNQNNFSVVGRALTYKSAASLNTLYPKSNLKLYTPTFVPEDPNAKFSGYIPVDQIQVTYSRSSGAGGQNVNCVNTKVDLRFHVKDAKWLAEDVKEKLLEMYTNKINKDGYLIIKSELTRSQQLNLADAMEKLRSMIRKTLQPPSQISPETEEIKRKRMLKAARERVHEKRMKSQIKQDKLIRDI